MSVSSPENMLMVTGGERPAHGRAHNGVQQHYDWRTITRPGENNVIVLVGVLNKAIAILLIL